MKRPAVWFALGIVALAAGAAAVRLPRLAMRPMHCDEANQAKRAGLLLDKGEYKYDPVDHHGPSLYWLTLPSLGLSGAGDYAHSGESAYRIVPVVFGVGVVLLVLLVGDGLGRGAAIWAALLAAVSPAMVFFSRYYVQEMLLVFFTFATIACGWRYCRGRAIGWAAAAGLSLGMMIATKETWVLAAFAMAAGLVLTIAWGWWREGKKPDVLPYFRPLAIVAALAAACLVVAIFYSSFGRDWEAWRRVVDAYANYVRRGTEGGDHAHPWYYYVQILVAWWPARGYFWSEGLIVGLAVVGAVVALAAGQGGQSPFSPSGITPSDKSSPAKMGTVPAGSSLAKMGTVPGAKMGTVPAFCRFLGFYTLVLLVVYSAISYKTPWCMLSVLHGMTLLAGVGIAAVFAWRPRPGGLLRKLGVPAIKAAFAVLLAAGLVHLGWECALLNFGLRSITRWQEARDRFHVEHRNPYVYQHTSTDMLKLAVLMEELAGHSPEGHDMIIHVVTPENVWPLPWYLRQFNEDRTGYWPSTADWVRDAQQCPAPAVIILTPDVQEVVAAGLRARYNRQTNLSVRPEVLVLVYIREDLWEALMCQRRLTAEKIQR